ncbi:MAG: EscU/YscU/HrcU family type III secretion system export apparatus switch protein, partial [Pontixanthobacter sp.]
LHLASGFGAPAIAAQPSVDFGASSIPLQVRIAMAGAIAVFVLVWTPIETPAEMLTDAMNVVIVAIVSLGALVTIAIVCSQMQFGEWRFVPADLAFKGSRLNSVEGPGRIFGPNGRIELGKSLLKKSPRDMRDEQKTQEGSPEKRTTIRGKQRQLAMGGVAKAMNDAQFVLTNPTHFSVAMTYDPTPTGAPILRAKGRGDKALAIRELAGEERSADAGIPRARRVGLCHHARKPGDPRGAIRCHRQHFHLRDVVETWRTGAASQNRFAAWNVDRNRYARGNDPPPECRRRL